MWKQPAYYGKNPPTNFFNNPNKLYNSLSEQAIPDVPPICDDCCPISNTALSEKR